MAADPDDMELIRTLYHTAGRISEILNMTWQDVNFEQQWVRLWTRKRMGNFDENNQRGTIGGTIS